MVFLNYCFSDLKGLGGADNDEAIAEIMGVYSKLTSPSQSADI